MIFKSKIENKITAIPVNNISSVYQYGISVCNRFTQADKIDNFHWQWFLFILLSKIFKIKLQPLLYWFVINTENYKKLTVAQTDIHREIIELSKAGDNAAQYKLYSLYAKAMFNVAYRVMNNREEAEDQLQEAFTQAFRKLKTFRYESSFGSWLKRIVINHCLNEIKRRKADLQFFEDMNLFDQKEDDSNGYESGLSVENVRKAMEFLPSGSKMIFSLYLLEGYDHREISQILSISESNSKSQYMRAKIKLKEVLKNMNHETR